MATSDTATGSSFKRIMSSPAGFAPGEGSGCSTSMDWMPRIFVARSVVLPVGVVGIMKAGCGYVALSDMFPSARKIAVTRKA